MITNIAGVDVYWNCQRTSEHDKLSTLFRYHAADTCCSEHGGHTVNFITVPEAFAPPCDIKLEWEGSYMNVDFRVYAVPSTKEEIIVLSEETWIVHNRAKRQTDCYVYDKNIAGQDLDKHTLDAVLIIVHAVMAMNQRYVLHAASVSVSGEAFVFLGESGLGKSTLCADLLRQGADFMGDDIVFLYKHKEKLMVGGLLFDAKLYPNATSRAKASYDFVRQYNCKGVLQASLSSIFRLSRTGETHSTKTRRSPYEAMLSLMDASNNIRMQYDCETWLSLIQQTAETIPYFKLNYGSIGSVGTALLTDESTNQL